MPRKYLTDKEQKVIDSILKGRSPIDAVNEAYDVKDRNSARVIACKLQKKNLFNEELIKKRDLIKQITQDEGKKLVEILEEIFPKRERMEILVSIARGNDGKSQLEALKEINKLEGEYPRQEPERPQIGGLQIVMIKPGEQKKELEESNKLPIIEEGQVIKEDSAGNKEDNQEYN